MNKMVKDIQYKTKKGYESARDFLMDYAFKNKVEIKILGKSRTNFKGENFIGDSYNNTKSIYFSAYNEEEENRLESELKKFNIN